MRIRDGDVLYSAAKDRRLPDEIESGLRRFARNMSDGGERFMRAVYGIYGAPGENLELNTRHYLLHPQHTGFLIIYVRLGETFVGFDDLTVSPNMTGVDARYNAKAQGISLPDWTALIDAAKRG
jgi:hypothetical protein